MGPRELAYKLYERRLEASLSAHSIPRHVGVILDGNRRWARMAGLSDVSRGHQKGADHIFELLGWCRQAGVEVVTLWLLSTDNLARSGDEVEALLGIIESTVRGLVAQGWHVKPVGALDLLPVDTAQVLKDAAEATANNPGVLVNVAVGYGGRREIADAVRSLLHDHATKGTSIEELAEILDVEHIADHLYTAGQPDPDLVIRTSGEQRLGGFLLRRLLAGLPPGGLPPGAAILRRAASPVRRLRHADRPLGSPGSPPGQHRRWVLPGIDPGLYRRNWKGGV
jgi:short-chain Z-isoprenyl diphosphate synthase